MTGQYYPVEIKSRILAEAMKEIERHMPELITVTDKIGATFVEVRYFSMILAPIIPRIVIDRKSRSVLAIRWLLGRYPNQEEQHIDLKIEIPKG